MARWLVTGAAGFLGSHLVDRMLAAGHTVIGLDDLSTGSRDNLRDALRDPRFELRVGDVREGLPAPSDLDGIANFASPASPVRFVEDPRKTLTTNVLGALHIAELVAVRPTLRVLQASTSEVYGDAEVHPQVETYSGNVNPIGPRACYDEGKRAAETLLVDTWRKQPFPLQILRIFNTYGRRMALDDGRVISNWLVAALRRQPIRIHGDGTQTRAFCFVDDTIDAFMAAMSLETFDGPINVGNPDERTLLSLAERIASVVGTPLALHHVALPEDDPRRRCPDIGRARARLGYAPRVSLDEGLARTAADFRVRVGIG